jgi:hypothetical protein
MAGRGDGEGERATGHRGRRRRMPASMARAMRLALQDWAARQGCCQAARQAFKNRL